MRTLTTIAIILSFLITAAGAEPIRTSIQVDASKDLGTIKPLWRDFAEGSESGDADYLVNVLDWMKPLKPRLVRTDTTMHFSGIGRDQSGNLTFDFKGLDLWIESIKGIGADPLICLSYVPVALRDGKREIDPPSDLKAWEEVVYQIVEHVNIDKKYNVTYWESWNEPNLTQFWTGTMQQSLEVYAATVRGALRADPSIRIGGGTWAGFPEDWAAGLLDYVKTNKLRLDFVSWHAYNVPPEYFKQTSRRMKGMLHDRGMEAQTMITEWNWHPGMDPGNDNEVGAAYAARTLHQMVDSPLDYALFFEIKDGWKADSRYWGRWGLMTFDQHPKAIYYAYQAFSKLGTERISMLGGIPGINGLATRTGDGIQILLYNSGSNSKAVVSLDITGLPHGNPLWQRYLVDEAHSNPVNQGNDSKLEKVEDMVVTANGGKLHTDLELDKNSVTLITIQTDHKRADLPKPLPKSIAYDYQHLQTGAKRVTVSPTIDGDLSDWHSKTVPAGYGNHTADIRFAWNEQALFVAVEAHEEELINNQPDSQIWAGDSVQIGFDPLADARLIDGYNTDDYEYGFAQNASGPIVWRWECPGWREAGLVKNVEVAVKRNGTAKTTTYEIAIPWSELDPFKPKVGAVLNTGVTVNDFDMQGNRITIEWGGGIAGNKQPAAFRPVMLVD